MVCHFILCEFVFDQLIFGRAGSSLLCRLFSSCGGQGLLCSCSTQASPFSGFSFQWLLLQWLLLSMASLVAEHRLQTRGLSRCGSQALECGICSCGTWTFTSGMWNLHRLRTELMSPALAGKFLTNGPLGKYFFQFFHLSYSNRVTSINPFKDSLLLFIFVLPFRPIS